VKQEYIEGKEATKRSEGAMKKLVRVPTPQTQAKETQERQGLGRLPMAASLASIDVPRRCLCQ